MPRSEQAVRPPIARWQVALGLTVVVAQVLIILIGGLKGRQLLTLGFANLVIAAATAAAILQAKPEKPVKEDTVHIEAEPPTWRRSRWEWVRRRPRMPVEPLETAERPDTDVARPTSPPTSAATSKAKVAAVAAAGLAVIAFIIFLALLYNDARRAATGPRTTINPGTDADLSNADLRGRNLSGLNFKGSNFAKANLRGADLQGAVLTDANLEGADLALANLRAAVLRGADLRGADLRGTDLQRAVADSRTRWPDRFNPADAGVLLE